jgi:hypothetical protein
MLQRQFDLHQTRNKFTDKAMSTAQYCPVQSMVKGPGLFDGPGNNPWIFTYVGPNCTQCPPNPDIAGIGVSCKSFDHRVRVSNCLGHLVLHCLCIAH